MKALFASKLSLALLALAFTSLYTHAADNGLSDFNVAISGTDVKVTWAASSPSAEVFEVQVATEPGQDGELTFTGLAELPAGKASVYEFTDVTPSKQGIRYYRVMQVELNGKVTFSETATANFQNQKHFTLNVSTAPGLSGVELGINTTTASTAKVTLTSLVATYTLTKDVTVTNGTTAYIIEVDPSAPIGPYLLTFELNGDVQLRLLTKESPAGLTVNN